MTHAGTGRSGAETLRSLVHLFYGTFALLLRFTAPAAAVGLAALAVLHNFFLLPRYGARLLRESDLRPPGGIHFYPIGVLLLVLLLRNRLPWAAAAWGVLAFGDASAALVGRAFPGRGLPWNRRKSWAGFAAYGLAGSAAAACLLVWVAGGSARPIPWSAAWWPAAGLGLLGAAVESLDTRLDDNATVSAALLVVLLAAGDASAAAWHDRLPELIARIGPAAGVGGLLAAVAWRLGHVSTSGAVVGLVLAVSLWVLAGPGAFGLFVLFFVLAGAATRYGRGIKEARSVAQESGGRRGARQALANVGVPVGAAVMVSASATPEPYLLAIGGGLATAAFDTVSSEIGQVLGRRTLLITTFRPVPIGTEGGVSREGTLAGLGAAALVAAAGAGAGLYGWTGAGIVLGAAVIGGTAESVIAASAAGRGLGNDSLNFLNTALGAGICLAVGRAVGV